MLEYFCQRHALIFIITPVTSWRAVVVPAHIRINFAIDLELFGLIENCPPAD
jgi:hypothetical protein